jgi:hypothetical protein
MLLDATNRTFGHEVRFAHLVALGCSRLYRYRAKSPSASWSSASLAGAHCASPTGRSSLSYQGGRAGGHAYRDSRYKCSVDSGRFCACLPSLLSSLARRYAVGEFNRVMTQSIGIPHERRPDLRSTSFPRVRPPQRHPARSDASIQPTGPVTTMQRPGGPDRRLSTASCRCRRTSSRSGREYGMGMTGARE